MGNKITRKTKKNHRGGQQRVKKKLLQNPTSKADPLGSEVGNQGKPPISRKGGLGYTT